MNNAVSFTPWIGPKYCKAIRTQSLPGGLGVHAFPDLFSWGTRHRILMLGDSPYLWDTNNQSFAVMNNEQDFNTFLITKSTDNPKNKKRYATAGAVITGLYNTGMQVYDELAFTNFFQGFVGAGPKSKIYAPQLLAQSCNALEKVLDVLKPNLVIVWGIDKRGLKGRFLPRGNHECPDGRWTRKDNILPPCYGLTLKRPTDLETWTYDTYPDATFWAIKHPSSGFSYEYWHELFKCVLQTLPHI